MPCGSGANGPSKMTTWLWLASGRTPHTAGYLLFSCNWFANRLAATPASGEVPQIIGSVPDRSRASPFAGLTNASLSGRHRCAARSSSAAAAS